METDRMLNIAFNGLIYGTGIPDKVMAFLMKKNKNSITAVSNWNIYGFKIGYDRGYNLPNLRIVLIHPCGDKYTTTDVKVGLEGDEGILELTRDEHDFIRSIAYADWKLRLVRKTNKNRPYQTLVDILVDNQDKEAD
ncbi:MAG: hypothetical protein MUD10_04830 [Candidatus Pacebacteria bacterium]|jgi:hypothetical protein|nr:hypothetical protein [Candidatus Paceibacterota bacterium]